MSKAEKSPIAESEEACGMAKDRILIMPLSTYIANMLASVDGSYMLLLL